MKKRTTVLVFVMSTFLAAPIAVVATFMLSRFWDWFEKKTGIESMGHSGPANWCFVLIYVLLLAAALITFAAGRRKPPDDIA